MQITNDSILKEQIMAGLKGRMKGHSFESKIVERLNSIVSFAYEGTVADSQTIFYGEPEKILLNKMMQAFQWHKVISLKAYATGRLATAEEGEKCLNIDGHPIKGSKSDLIVDMQNDSGERKITGVSVKQCSNRTPTNAQVFFTTASAFYNLLKERGLIDEPRALVALKQFCGDEGFRPSDAGGCEGRISTPERFFWEETDPVGRAALEKMFAVHQDEVTALLLKKGYVDDPFPPSFIMHKTRSVMEGPDEIAMYSMEQFIKLSHQYASFHLSPYRVTKGRYKEPVGILHDAPRFGVIQMQRGGQKQHPTQLQFNLKAGYFYDLAKF